jgi:hypothetical protein
MFQLAAPASLSAARQGLRRERRDVKVLRQRDASLLDKLSSSRAAAATP